MLGVLIIAICTPTVAAASFNATRASFAEWQSAHGLSYTGDEELKKRFEIFQSNLRYVKQHNARADAGLSSYRMRMNHFAALSNDEFRAQFLRPVSSSSTPRRSIMAQQPMPPTSIAPPESLNWIDAGILPGIKDQGSCGSCWSFSAVAAMEGAFNKAHANNNLPAACNSTCGNAPATRRCCSFSEQEVADCTNNGKDTCSVGGEMHDGVMTVVANRGRISLEAAYPYVSGTTKKLTACDRPTARDAIVQTGITGYANVTSGDEDALLRATAAHGVVSVGIDASSLGFQLYDSGIYVDDEGCGNNVTSLDHGVAVVGYGTGQVSPPGPLPPPPGPENCDRNFKKPACVGEKGCHWCVDKTGFGYCFNQQCVPTTTAAQVHAAGTGTMMDGREEGKQQAYWLVRNSWSMNWGMGGYVAMARNRNNLCGISTDAIVAIVGK